MNIGQLRQQYPDEDSCRHFLKLHDSLRVVYDRIADTMPSILTSATGSVWVVVNVGIECVVNRHYKNTSSQH